MTDMASASNSTTIIPSGREFPIKFSKNAELKFPIPATPQIYGHVRYAIQVSRAKFTKLFQIKSKLKLQVANADH